MKISRLTLRMPTKDELGGIKDILLMLAGLFFFALLVLALLSIIGCHMPVPVTRDEAPPAIVYEVEIDGALAEEVAALPGGWAGMQVGDHRVRFRARPLEESTADGDPPCPCPQFVLSRGGVLVQGEDPDSPPPCGVPTNCGRHIYIPAEVLGGCEEEARERGEP